MSMFVPDLSNEPALTMVRMHNDLTRRLLVIRVIMINALLSGLLKRSKFRRRFLKNSIPGFTGRGIVFTSNLKTHLILN